MLKEEGCLWIDLNCDMGEGMDTDTAIFPYISSANIACGYHAGDTDTMRRTIDLALEHRVAIGAHPSYPDRSNFGRVDILDSQVRMKDLPDLLTDQLVTLQKICERAGTQLHHVKPHGALYNRAAKDPVVSALICQVLKSFDPSLFLYGLSGSEMKTQANLHGTPFISEVFADRTYREDGSLTPRTEPHAMIRDPVLAIGQVLKMVTAGTVSAVRDKARPETSGEAKEVAKEVAITAETVCIHGDGSHAVAFVRVIRETLEQEGILLLTPADRNI